MPARTPHADPVAGGAPRSGKHVLVVDDDTMMLALVKTALRRQGYRVTTAGDGRAALTLLEAELPDLVVSDVNMPGLSGFSLLSSVRSDPRTRLLPVVLLTTRRDVADIVEGLALGADDYLTKPFAVPELLARIRSKLDRPPVPLDLLPVDRDTGLVSRARFGEELTRELARAGRSGRPGVVGVIGLSELPGLALRLGGGAADAALRQVAAALRAVMRPLDVAGRVDVHHIGVMMPETSAEEGKRRLHAAIAQVATLAIHVDSEVLRITPSAGLATFGDGDEPVTLVARAVVALDFATAHLDLQPRRWEPRLDPDVAAQRAAAAALAGPTPGRGWARRLRTPSRSV